MRTPIPGVPQARNRKRHIPHPDTFAPNLACLLFFLCLKSLLLYSFHKLFRLTLCSMGSIRCYYYEHLPRCFEFNSNISLSECASFTGFVKARAAATGSGLEERDAVDTSYSGDGILAFYFYTFDPPINSKEVSSAVAAAIYRERCANTVCPPSLHPATNPTHYLVSSTAISDALP